MRQDVTLGNNKKINVEIFDTAGQKRFRTITTAYYKASRAFLLVFDLGKRDSFDAIEQWIVQIDKFAQRKHVRFLIGNKCDSDRVISYDEAMDWAKENNCEYFEISAKTGKNIDSLFAKVMDVRSKISTFSLHHIFFTSFTLLYTQEMYGTKKKKDKKGKKSKKETSEPGGCCVVQ